MVGMLATGLIIVWVGGSASWDDATIAYPTQCLLGMAVGMAVPMVAWMLHREMGWREHAARATTLR